MDSVYEGWSLGFGVWDPHVELYVKMATPSFRFLLFCQVSLPHWAPAPRTWS